MAARESRYFTFRHPHANPDTATADFKDIESLAAQYIDELRNYAPEGPYLFAGYSLGGMIAFEMARQLIIADARVGQLFLFDTRPFNLPRRIFWRMAWPHWRSRAAFHFREWITAPPGHRWA